MFFLEVLPQEANFLVLLKECYLALVFFLQHTYYLMHSSRGNFCYLRCMRQPCEGDKNKDDSSMHACLQSCHLNSKQRRSLDSTLFVITSAVVLQFWFVLIRTNPQSPLVPNFYFFSPNFVSNGFKSVISPVCGPLCHHFPPAIRV